MFSVAAICCLMLNPQINYAAALHADNVFSNHLMTVNKKVNVFEELSGKNIEQFKVMQEEKALAMMFIIFIEPIDFRYNVPVSPTLAPVEVRVIGNNEEVLYLEWTNGANVVIPDNINVKDIKQIKVMQYGRVIIVVEDIIEG